MDIQSNENSIKEAPISSDEITLQCDVLGPDKTNNGGLESKCGASDEVKVTLQVIASTGKFWYEWDKLKHVLSFQLKQVLSEYPEAKMDIVQQKSLLGESFSDLAGRLNEALLSFIEGPPFTLQRLCEILLNPGSIYPNLSKLSLALEKNLLVSSTLSICKDPQPQIEISKEEIAKEEEAVVASNVENGVGDGDGDIIMRDAVDSECESPIVSIAQAP